MVFSSEVPIEAPSCWPTVTVAEATPASCRATPNVPVLADVEITMPLPSPARMIGPSTPAAYPVCGPSWASQTVASAWASIPDAPTGLGPTLGITTTACSTPAGAPSYRGEHLDDPVVSFVP